MDTFVAILEFVLGLVLIFFALTSAFRTVVLPRAAFDPLTRVIFLGLRRLLLSMSRLSDTRFSRETVLGVHAPLGLLAMALAWALGIMFGFTLLLDATGDMDLGRAFVLAGSSFTTLGFEPPEQGLHELLSISAAVLGLAIVALLIAYLPTIYGLFSKREVVVADISIKCDGPTYGPGLVGSLVRDGDPIRLDEMWMDWEHWFIALGETHTSEPSLNFFRSPRGDRSWLTSAMAVLDASVIRNVVVKAPFSARADMTYRAGVESVHSIAHFFFIRPEDGEHADSLISRSDFDEAVEFMAERGVLIVEDRDEAWTSFVEQRSRYELQMLGLDKLLMPPGAPWSPGNSE